MKPCTRLIWLGWLVVVLCMTTSCESYDLGGEPTANVVLSANASWNNGIGKLVKAKCANCHRPDRTQFTPANTPVTMDDIGEESFFNARLNGLRVQLVRSRVFDSTVPMPPLFGDQLNESEALAFKNYLDRILEQAGLAGCPAEETTLTFADVAPIIAEHCAGAGCHENGQADRQPLTTLEEMKAQRMASLTYLNSKYMPYGGDGSFLTTEDGAALLSWLCRGADVTAAFRQ